MWIYLLIQRLQIEADSQGLELLKWAPTAALCLSQLYFSCGVLHAFECFQLIFRCLRSQTLIDVFLSINSSPCRVFHLPMVSSKGTSWLSRSFHSRHRHKLIWPARIFFHCIHALLCLPNPKTPRRERSNPYLIPKRTFQRSDGIDIHLTFKPQLNSRCHSLSLVPNTKTILGRKKTSIQVC